MSRTALADRLVGTELGDYRIEALLGRGGMGAVYLAEQRRLRRRVALKLVGTRFAGDERFRERFLRESELAASVEHPNLVPVYDAGEADGHLYLAMRYVEGTDLKGLLHVEGRLAPQRALALLAQAASGLDAAHARGLIHRDVTPGNLIVGTGREPGHERVFVCDFGLSGLDSLTDEGTEGEFGGTPDYVSPEQVLGEGSGPSADTYSFGCVLFECLAGRPPFERENALATLWAHVQEPPPSLAVLRPELPPSLDDVVARALAKDPAERFASCSDLVAAARVALGLEGWSCAACATENGPEAQFCPACGAAAVVVRKPRPAGTRKTVTLVFSELDTATLDELAGAQREHLTARWRDAARGVLEHHGGTMEPMAGEAVLGVFGVPVLHEDDALRGVRAALEIRDLRRGFLDQLESGSGVEPACRTAVVTGEVVTGNLAAGQGLVIGEPVQAAARLARRCAPGEVVVSDGTARIVRDAATLEPIDPRAGPAPEPCWRAHAVLPAATVLPRRLDAPMVGRHRELSLLRDCLERVRTERTSHLVTVLGDAGIGKSRLLGEFGAAAQDKATVLVGRCLSYGEGITYWPIAEIVNSAVGGDPRSSLDSLLDAEPDRELIAARIAGAIGLAPAALGREETFWAVRRLCESLAGKRPLVLAFEDVHWAEPTLLDLVEYLADWTRGAPILLICLARPELLDGRPAWSGGKLNATSLLLEPLSASDCDRLVDNVLGDLPLGTQARNRAIAAAEGNPLFLEQLVALVAEDGDAAPELPAAPAIHALLAARLDKLEPDERRLIECASVEGLVFHVAPLGELATEVSATAFGRSLLSLVRKGLVKPDRSTLRGDEALRFRHNLIRDAAYRAMTEETRARLHLRFASFLERVAGERMLELEEILGYHLERAFRYQAEFDAPDFALGARAASHLSDAGRRALAREDLPAGINLLERAAAMRQPNDPERLRLLPELGAALTEAGRLGEAKTVLAEGTRVARALADERLEARALVERLALELQTATDESVAGTREVGGQLAAVFRRHGDELGMCRLRRLEGLIWWVRGRAAAAGDAWETAAALARRAGAQRELADILLWLASSAFSGPSPVGEAIRRCEEVRAELADHRHAQAWVLQPLAGLHAMAGRFRQAEELLSRSSEVIDELGPAMFEAPPFHAAFVAMLAGDPVAAERCLRGGHVRLQEMGEKALLAGTAAALAEALYEQARYEEADELAREAAETAGRADLIVQFGWRSVRAKVLARRGRRDEAVALASESQALAEQTDLMTHRGDVLMGLAEVLRLVGHEGEAAASAGRAIALYERKGNIVRAARAKAALGERAGARPDSRPRT